MKEVKVTYSVCKCLWISSKFHYLIAVSKCLKFTNNFFSFRQIFNLNGKSFAFKYNSLELTEILHISYIILIII